MGTLTRKAVTQCIVAEFMPSNVSRATVSGRVGRRPPAWALRVAQARPFTAAIATHPQRHLSVADFFSAALALHAGRGGAGSG